MAAAPSLELAGPARRPRTVLVSCMERCIGRASAAQVVSEAAEELGFGEELLQEEALALLERLALRPGLVGVVARFATVRVHLAWANGAD